MEDKVTQRLDVLKRQHAALAGEMDALRAESQKLQGRMSEVGQMMAAVHGGIVALESLLPENPAETVVEG